MEPRRAPPLTRVETSKGNEKEGGDQKGVVSQSHEERVWSAMLNAVERTEGDISVHRVQRH